MSDSAADSLPRLGVTSLSQYIRLNNCNRYLRFRLRPDEARAMEARFDATIQPLTPLLKEEGYAFESAVEQQIAARGEAVERIEGDDASLTRKWLQEAQTPIILLQAPVAGRLGRYQFSGRADVVRCWRDDAGLLHIYVADIKASRRERAEHRLQVTAYAFLLRQMAEADNIAVGTLRGGVLHMGDEGDLPEVDLEAGFDLESYLTILGHVILDEDSVVERVAGQRFDEIPYHLTYRCDGCLYNALCMWDTAERQDLSFVPYMSAPEKRVLQQHGIRTASDLADLMQMENGSLAPAPGKEAKVGELANIWPVGAKLPELVARAQSACALHDRSRRAPSYIPDSGYGTLPADDDNPGLVKIFFDAQHDYLRNSIYLLAALVRGPRGEQAIVEMNQRAPEPEDEATLLGTWVRRILAAVKALAAGSEAPIHLYCYNPYDQRVLLDALKRHLGAVGQIPGFFDLITQHPALDQPVISFLANELQKRKNLGLICPSLHDAARYTGFNWDDGERAFYQLFRARIFDNRRDAVRSFDGTLAPAPRAVPPGDPRRLRIESASRFNSQIPLEYAYAVWGMLPEDPEDPRILHPFRAVTQEDLVAFAAHRVRALAHLEGQFLYKARFLDKHPIDLASLGEEDTGAGTLANALREFLYMEHHASLQARLQTYGLPIAQRTQTGLALLLRAQGGVNQDRFRFTIAFSEMGLDPVLTMNTLRLKEGAWVVLNPVSETSTGRIKHGRLAVIEAVTAETLELKLMGMTARGSYFKYHHKRDLVPVPGDLYTIDEMADDLNADKALEAIGHAAGNTLYRWMEELPDRRILSETDDNASAAFGSIVNMLEHPNVMTGPQREVIIERLVDPLFLVQGPPGTGKSHTLGWAILSRLLVAAQAGRPLRVAVSCKTHNAISIVLESVAQKWRRLAEYWSRQRNTSLPFLNIYKLANEDDAAELEGVTMLSPYTAGSARLEEVLAEPYVVIGGTPGGLYNLARYREAGGNKQVGWEYQDFDLLVIDEASQMSMPEAVLAAAFLKPDGSMIVVGDHRQMPPIVAHDWENEARRSTADRQPFRSLFETLLARGLPRVALDESFRLHAEMASFLEENIYRLDGIPFFSRQTHLLPPLEPIHPYVDRILAPEYPIVVIEHTEEGSQQFNAVEAAILEPILRICIKHHGLDGRRGIGVVVPHRAQRAYLREKFPSLADTNAIDTVERFQGGERDVIIVSATASDPDYVLAEAEFLLNLNRLNVALSRPRKKLIVIASQSVTRLLVSDLDIFENSMIWKRLYYTYANEPLFHGKVKGVPVRARGHRANGKAMLVL